ncbi:MAG: hypothetical protein EXQ69_10960 [Acidimicrobiia bacterium]|nr:hypothetical protein [Acidimicrobiia bacterium]
MLLTQAIQHAHQKWIIHRDIKPSNVLMGQRLLEKPHMSRSLLGELFRFLRREGVAGLDLTDGAILDRRDEVAFETLVQRHGPMIMGVCLRVVGDTHAGEDAFQATFAPTLLRALLRDIMGLISQDLDIREGGSHCDAPFVKRRTPGRSRTLLRTSRMLAAFEWQAKSSPRGSGFQSECRDFRRSWSPWLRVSTAVVANATYPRHARNWAN